jgi:zinc finger protein DZIP1
MYFELVKKLGKDKVQFESRRGRVNHSALKGLDIDKVLATGDPETLKIILENITYSKFDIQDLNRFEHDDLRKLITVG